MKPHPTTTTLRFLCLIFITFLINNSCTKDSDLLRDAVLDTVAPGVNTSEDSSTEEEASAEGAETEIEEENEEAETEEEHIAEKVFEPRTTIFTPLHDAHLQSGKGYNQEIVRLEENHRTSYLMFDLSQIDSIGGQVTETRLEFTIDTDDGDGKITVSKGSSNDWSEDNLSESTAPEPDLHLGEIESYFSIGETHEVTLDTTNIDPNIITLVLTHEAGNDLAFASKENPEREGPKLIVSYKAPQDSEAILGEEGIEENTPTQEDSATEETEGTSEPTDTEEEVPSSEEEESITPSNEGPTAVANASPTSGTAPLKVSFNGSSSVDDNGVIQFSWDFKDGDSSDESSPTHTFTEAGDYEVALTVKDEEGVQHTDTVTITVTEEKNEKPESLPKASHHREKPR